MPRNRWPWQLPPARRPVVADNRRIVPRSPGTPGAFLGADDATGAPGQILNDGDSPGLPSGVSLDPSASAGTNYSGLQTDTGGQIRIITTPVVGPAAGGPTNQVLDLPVPQDVICWELISITVQITGGTQAMGDQPQLTFDDGPFAAAAHGNIYFLSQIDLPIGVGQLRLPITWYQGCFTTETNGVPQAGRPLQGALPRNNRILSGHHIRWAFNRDIDPATNWGQMFAVACVREWRAPR
jgi:hypothetical protein